VGYPSSNRDFEKLILKSVNFLVAGSAIGQVLAYLLLPFLALFYSPNELGEFAFIISVASILTIMMTGRLEIPLGFSKNNYERDQAISAILLLIGTLIIVIFIGLAIIALTGKNYLPDFNTIILSTSCAFILSIERLAHYYLTSRAKLKVLTLRKSLTPVTTLIAQMIYTANYSLSIGFILTRFFLNFNTLRQILLNTEFSIQNGFNFIKKQKNFLIISTPAGIFSALNNSILIFFITYYLGAFTAGLVFLAQKLTVGPISVISPAIHQSLMMNNTAAQDNQRSLFQHNIEKISFHLSYVTWFGVLVSTYVFNSSMYDISNVAPESWTEIIWLLPYFIILASIQLVVMTFNIYYQFSGKQLTGLFSQIIIFVSKILGVVISFQNESMTNETMHTFSIIVIIGYTLSTLLMVVTSRYYKLFVMQLLTIGLGIGVLLTL